LNEYLARKGTLWLLPTSKLALWRRTPESRPFKFKHVDNEREKQMDSTNRKEKEVTTYEAGATLARWDREALERHPAVHKGDRP